MLGIRGATVSPPPIPSRFSAVTRFASIFTSNTLQYQSSPMIWFLVKFLIGTLLGAYDLYTDGVVLFAAVQFRQFCDAKPIVAPLPLGSIPSNSTEAALNDTFFQSFTPYFVRPCAAGTYCTDNFDDVKRVSPVLSSNTSSWHSWMDTGWEDSIGWQEACVDMGRAVQKVVVKEGLSRSQCEARNFDFLVPFGYLEGSLPYITPEDTCFINRTLSKANGGFGPFRTSNCSVGRYLFSYPSTSTPWSPYATSHHRPHGFYDCEDDILRRDPCYDAALLRGCVIVLSLFLSISFLTTVSSIYLLLFSFQHQDALQDGDEKLQSPEFTPPTPLSTLYFCRLALIPCCSPRPSSLVEVELAKEILGAITFFVEDVPGVLVLYLLATSVSPCFSNAKYIVHPTEAYQSIAASSASSLFAGLTAFKPCTWPHRRFHHLPDFTGCWCYRESGDNPTPLERRITTFGTLHCATATRSITFLPLFAIVFSNLITGHQWAVAVFLAFASLALVCNAVVYLMAGYNNSNNKKSRKQQSPRIEMVPGS